MKVQTYMHIYVYMACTYVEIHIVNTTKTIPSASAYPLHTSLHAYKYGIIVSKACGQV